MKYFFSLYWRNIKGAFIKGFTYPLDKLPADPAGIPLMFTFWGIHVLLMPITLTLGAGFKTLIDYCTRKFTPLKQIKPTLEAIEKADSEEVNTFIEKMTSSKYSTASNSSSDVKNNLLIQDEYQNLAIFRSIDAKREELLKQQRISKPSPFFNDTNELRDEFLREFYDYKYSPLITKAQDKGKEVRVKLGRELFTDYIKDEKNNGKKLFQNLVNFFSQPAKPESSETRENKNIQLS